MIEWINANPFIAIIGCLLILGGLDFLAALGIVGLMGRRIIRHSEVEDRLKELEISVMGLEQAVFDDSEHVEFVDENLAPVEGSKDEK